MGLSWKNTGVGCHFLLQWKQWDMQVHETKRTSKYQNIKRPSSRQICVKIVKSKWQRKNFKCCLGRNDGNLQRTPPSFYQQISPQKLYKPGKSRMTHSEKFFDTFKILKNENCQARIQQLSFRYVEEIKAFLDKQKLRKFTSIKHALQELLKGTLLSEKTKVHKTLSKVINRIRKM